MNRYKFQYPFIVIAICVLFFFSACKKDFVDPSRASQEEVFSSIAGLTGVDVGLQMVYSLNQNSSLYNIVSINALVTHEVFLLNQGNANEALLTFGGARVDGANTLLTGLWITSNKINYDADNVIKAAAGLSDKGYASGLIGYATVFKALSLGAMSMFWENLPDGNGNKAKFISRNEGFTRAIAAIDQALASISTNPVSASFTANVPPGIDIANTLQALKARYSLFLGSFDQALTAAGAVDLTKKSVLNFEAANPNPIFAAAGSNFNLYQPVDSTMGLPVSLAPDLSDKRVPFYMQLSGSSAARFLMKGFVASSTTAYPLYTPGEMMLIKAEAYARKSPSDLGQALTELNKVITKTPSQDPYGVGADLPPITGSLTQPELLTQIYRNRCIELYMSGLKLEDMRRFGRPDAERTRNFMPYPFRERDSNPENTPQDPIF